MSALRNTVIILFLGCTVLAFRMPLIAADAACASQLDSAGLFCEADCLPLPYRQTVVGAELPGPFDLVLFLHGAGERGDDNAQHLVFGYEPMRQFCAQNRIKAVLLFPQCPKRQQWSSIRVPEIDPPLSPEPTPPLASALRLLCEKKAEFNARHVFAVGISMGGYGVWDLLARQPELFTAGMAVCGGGDPQQACNLARVPLYVAHGSADILVPVARSRNMVKAIWDAGGDKVVYQEFPLAGHDVWNKVFEQQETWEWLFKKRGKPQVLPHRLSPRNLFPVPKVFPWQSRLF